MITLRLASQLDVIEISDNIRKSDVEEVYAATGDDITTALIDSFNASTVCWVAEYNRWELVSIFGVTPSPIPAVGIPWMLATDELYNHKKALIKISKLIITQMHSLYPVLTNYVDERNTQSISYLKWCGFEFPERLDHYGYEGRPFYQFLRKQ